MRSSRSSRGQASVEYVAVTALVGLVLAAATALTTGGLGPRVAYGIRLGLCRVTSEACPAPPADRADLDSCPVRREEHDESSSLSLAVVRLGTGLLARLERFSDGHAEVTFADSGTAGVGGAVGATFRLGRARAGAEASGDVSLGWTSGLVWRFHDVDAAQRFLKRYRSLQTTPGRVLNDAQKLCWKLCDVLGVGAKHLPAADFRFDEGTAHAGAQVQLGAEKGAAGRIDLSGALGVRRGIDGSRTYYLALGEAIAGRLFIGPGLQLTGRAAGVAALTVGRDGRPVRLAITTGGQVLAGHGKDKHRPRWLQQDFAGDGRLVERETVLDLTDPAAARAAHAILHGPARSAALDWLDRHAVSTLRAWQVGERHAGLGGSFGVGLSAGAEVGTDDSDARLVGVATKLPGLPFLARADCLAG